MNARHLVAERNKAVSAWWWLIDYLFSLSSVTKLNRALLIWYWAWPGGIDLFLE